MLGRLRKGPFLRSAPELVRALRRIDDVRGLGINLSVSSRVPPTRVQALARFATMAKASAIHRMPDHRRLGTLIAFVLNLEAIALDDALDLLDILITESLAMQHVLVRKLGSGRSRTSMRLPAVWGKSVRCFSIQASQTRPFAKQCSL